MSGEILVKVTDLHRHHGDVHAVRGLSFEIRRGEVVGFLGPNGAGKTTTMQILAGVVAPGSGRVEICGVDLLDAPVAAKRQVGYLPEIPPLYRELDVDEFLGYCARLHRVPRAERRAAVTRAKERCGLGEVGRRLIGNLSKGFRQRVGIAQAIIHGPAVVILDEPTVGLDPIQIREIRALVRELGTEHGVVLSTHILPEVQATCDRVQIIDRGRLLLGEGLENLTGAAQARVLRIGLHRAPAAAVLESMAGVERAEPRGGGCFALRCTGEPPAEAVARAAVAGDWGLFELVVERPTLEELFVDLTCGEPPEADGAAPGPATPPAAAVPRAAPGAGR